MSTSVRGKVRCSRCNKMVSHVVPTYWESKFGSFCMACCLKACKHYDKVGWPKLPKDWATEPSAESKEAPDKAPPTKESSRKKRDEALAQVDAAADAAWKEEAWAAMVAYLETHEEFFVDDLWEDGLSQPREARAIGPIILRAASQGLMKKTSKSRPSVRSNMSIKPIWRSMVFRATVDQPTTENEDADHERERPQLGV